MLVLALTTCTDNPTAPGHGGRAFLALQPVLTHPVDLSSFGLTIDSLRVTVVRPVADTVADTTVYFSPDSSEIHLRIPVVLRAAVESLAVHLALSAGGVVLFTGADTVPVSVASGGGGGGGSPVIVPLSYSGPGAGVDRLIVTPIDSAVRLNDSLRFRVVAESLGVPVPSFYVRWMTSDTTRARVNAFGVLRAPNHRDTISVIARTITGVSDTTRVTFVPIPTSLAVAGGNGQSGPVGQALGAALRARVTAADLLGVKGVVVAFAPVTPGATVGTPNAVTDDSGFTQTTATLATTSGAQSFQASVTGLTSVSFGATAVAGAPSQIAVVGGNARSDTVGRSLSNPLLVAVADTFNNPAGGAKVAWAVFAGTGTVAADTTVSLANGQAQVGFHLDTVPSVDSVRAVLVRSGVSVHFGVTGVASHPKRLTFSVQPSTVVVAAPISPAVQVAVRDTFGNPVPTATTPVTMALGANPGGATLSGTLTVPAVAGIATFSNLNLSSAATGYTLVASATGLVSGTSAPFDVTNSFTSHSADIIANETWTAAQSPHIVTAYLRVRSNATLTIAAGAVVKFDAGAGLQVGDTALGESGGLVLDGTAAPITMTANTGSPASGFWKGLEVQKRLAGPAWRRVLVEWGGGVRAGFGGNGPCILVADRTGAALDLDSLHLRQCGGAGGVVVVDGSVHLHRSVMDTTGLAGIAATNGVIEVDSTALRGVTTGVQLSNNVARLGPSSANQFLGNGVPIQLHAFQLPGVLRQDTIGGNTTNHIVVTTGQSDPAAPVVTLYRQPRGPTGFDYEVTGGGVPLGIGSASGQTLVLDSNAVVAFDPGGGLLIGDSAGTRSGSIRSQGTSRTNAPRLTSAQVVPAPGDWVGVEIGRLFQHDTLKNVRIEYAGDSIAGQAHRFGLLVRSPSAFRLVVDSVLVTNTGLATPDTNSAAVLVGAAGAGVEIRRSVVENNRGYGLAVVATPVRVVDDTLRNNYIGLVGFVGGGSSIGAADSLAGNMLGPGNTYPLLLLPGSLPMLYGNSVAGNLRDTLLLGMTPPPAGPPSRTQGPPPPPPQGSGFNNPALLKAAVLPSIPGQRWRVRSPIVIDSGASLRIDADTVAFDAAGGIFVGGRAPAGLHVDGATGGPGHYKLFTATPGHFRWGGIELDAVANSGDVLLRQLAVELAGQFIPPSFGCDCNGTAIPGIRVYDQTAGVSFLFDSLIVRQAITIALDVNRGALGDSVVVRASQFYQNPFSPMIRSPDPRQLAIHGSDLYHYRSQAIQSAFAGADSVHAEGNWWGDVSGPDSTFSFADSLGRASFDGNAVRYRPYATGPFFGVGPGVTLVAARDTFLVAGDTVLSAVGQRDSLRVRILDAEGRGAGGGTVSWSTTSGNLSPGGSDVDLGGRAGAQWHTGLVAGPHSATASGVGSPVVFQYTLLPGNTVGGVNWEIDPGYTLGAVSTDSNAATFTSTNRRARIIANAHDGHPSPTFPNGNPTSPNEFCFATPNGGCDFTTGASYGVVDSLSGGDLYFHTTTNIPPTFILRGLYEFGAGGQDSVSITMGSIAARVRIDRDVTTPGSVDTLPNPVVINALCRNGYPGGGPCSRELHAFVVDSGNTPVGNGTAAFVWSSPGSPDTAITIVATRGAPANDTAFVQAHTDGTTWVKVVNSGPQGGQDSVPILVQQVATSIAVAPSGDTLLVGQTATFRAAVLDPGGDTVHTLAVRWRIDEVPPHLSIIDSSVANQVTVRLDSTPFGQTAVTAFAIRAPGDTLFAYAYVFNPALARINVGSVPFGIAVNANTNRVYVANASSGDVSVVDGASDAVLTTVHVGFNANSVAVDAVLNKIYVTTDSAGASLAIIDGLTNSVTTLDAGTSPQGVAVDSINHVVYIATLLNPGPHPVLVPLDATADTFLVADTVPLPSSGMGVVFNPMNGRVYVAHNNANTVSVIDPATHAIAQTIVVGASPTTLAVDPTLGSMGLVYVTVNGTGYVAIIQGATGTVTDSVNVGTPEGIAVDPNLHRVYVGTTYPYGGLTAFENGPAGLTAPRFIPIAQSPYDNPQRVAYNGANGKVYAVQPSFNHVTRLQF